MGATCGPSGWSTRKKYIERTSTTGMVHTNRSRARSSRSSRCIARNEGRAILHRVLVARVWDRETGRVELLRTHVNQRRRKLGAGPSSMVRIVNDPGVGHRLVLNEGVQPI